MHNAAISAMGLAYMYIPFPVPPDSLETGLRGLSALGIVGVNLTIPHKERALAFVDEVTEEARQVGAINTVHCVDGRLVADNTDGRGFSRSLEEAGFDAAGRRVVVIGAGGAARSVVFSLARANVRSIVVANRTAERARSLAADLCAAGYSADLVRPAPLDDEKTLNEALASADLLVQTTRVGMFPDLEARPPVPAEALHRNLFVYDLVYNPMETRLLAEAAGRGCRTLSGIKMLVYQGAVSFERWTGYWPPTDVMEAAVREHLIRKDAAPQVQLR